MLMVQLDFQPCDVLLKTLWQMLTKKSNKMALNYTDKKKDKNKPITQDFEM